MFKNRLLIRYGGTGADESGKTLLVAEHSFRRLDASERLPEVAEGVVYVDGVQEKRGNAKVAAA
jgi:hypothetical protein